jgi:hypothetical protein
VSEPFSGGRSPGARFFVDPSRVNPATLRALWQARCVYPEQVPGFAVHLLAAGADSPVLRELAGMDRPTRAEVEPLVERLFLELGAAHVDEDTAWRAAAREIAAGAVGGSIALYDAAGLLYALWSTYDWPPELGSFPGLTDEWYEEFLGGRELMEAEILAACRRLLADLDPASWEGG